MMLQDLIMSFLRENGLKTTERFLSRPPNDNRPKLIRFVKGNKKYSIVFNDHELVLHLFKEKLYKRSPYQSVATVHGSKKSRGLDYSRTKIIVDLNNKDSLKQILDFL